MLPVLQGAFAQPITWTPYSGNPGCGIIVESGSGTLFGVIQGMSYPYLEKMIISTNGGMSWTENGIAVYNIYELVTNKRTNNIAYSRMVYARGTGVYEIQFSTDNGASWELTFSKDYPVSGIDPEYLMISDDGNLYAMNTPQKGYTQLLQCVKKNWSLVGSPLLAGDYLRQAVIDHANTVFVATGTRGVCYSTDYGVTWNRISALDTRPTVSLYVDSTNRVYAGTTPSGDLGTNGGVFVLSDTGKICRTMGLYGLRTDAMAIDSTGMIYADADPPTLPGGGVYRNRPGTTIWDDISPMNDYFTAIVFSRYGNLVVGGWGSTVFWSTDKGETWESNAIIEKDIFTLTSDDSGDIYAGTLGSGIYKTINGGANNWRQIVFGSICDYIYSFAHRGNDILAATECGVFRTTDHGTSWTNISSSSFNYYVYSIGVNSSGELFAGTTCGVFRCMGGDTVWYRSGLGTMKILQVTVDSRDNIYALTDGDGVFLSTDNGVSWANKGVARDDVLSLAVNVSDYVFIGEYGGVNRSTDYGQTWQEIPIGPVNVFSFASQGSSKIFAATTDGVYYSSNSGDSWYPAGSSGLNETFVLSLTIDQKGNLFAGTYRGGVYKSSHAITAVEAPHGFPVSSFLEQNYPNPFNPQTVIRFSISEESHVTLEIFNVLGQKIATPVNAKKSPGIYQTLWDGGDHPSGIYFYRLQAAGYVGVKKMLLMR